MKRFRSLFTIQLKRIGKRFPAVFLMTLILALCLGAVASLSLLMKGKDAGNERIRIGIVGDTEDTYLGIGISALENLDSSRYTIEFVELSESEAKSQISSGEISSYILIPEGFVDSVVSGENAQVTYCLGGSQAGVGAQLVMELSESISALVTESETGIYSMWDYYLLHGGEDHLYQDMDRLNIQYFEHILARERMFQINEIKGPGSLPLLTYYALSAVMVFLMLFGVNGGVLLIREDYAMEKMLITRGFVSWKQTLAEWISYLVFLFGCFYSLFILLGIGTRMAGFDLFGNSVISYPQFGIRLLPIVLMIASLQYLAYSLTDNLMTGLLLTFLGTVVLTFLSGCFFPVSSFPAVMQRVSACLPTGIGMGYMQKSLLGQPIGSALIGLLLYSAVFLLLAVFIKKWKSV